MAKERKPVATLREEMFRQQKPCSDCPFRKEGGVRHDPAQMAAYASYFLTYPGATFPCHQSVPKDDGRQEWSAWREGQTLCAGGMILAEKVGRQNAVVEAGKALGWFKRDELMRESAAVFDTVEEYLDAAVAEAPKE